MLKKAILTVVLAATATVSLATDYKDYARAIVLESNTVEQACEIGITQYGIAKNRAIVGQERQKAFYDCRRVLNGWEKAVKHENEWWNHYASDAGGYISDMAYNLGNGELFIRKRYLEVIALYAHNIEACEFDKQIDKGVTLQKAQHEAWHKADQEAHTLMKWIVQTVPSKLTHKRDQYVKNSYHQADLRKRAFCGES